MDASDLLQGTGAGRPALRVLRRAERELVSVRRGVHAPRDQWADLPPHERYRARVWAAVDALHDPILCRDSAAVIWGLPTIGEPRDIHLLITGTGHTHRRGDLVRHATKDARDIVWHDGVRVTSLLDTAIDLARTYPLAFGVAAMDAALAAGIDRSALSGRLLELTSARGAKRAWECFRASNARAESVLESISRVVAVALGFEVPELQREFLVDGVRRRADMWWESARVIGEADGNGKYFGVESALGIQRIRDERRRENALQLVAGRVIRWEWADVMAVEPFERILNAASIPRSGLRRNRLAALAAVRPR